MSRHVRMILLKLVRRNVWQRRTGKRGVWGVAGTHLPWVILGVIHGGRKLQELELVWNRFRRPLYCVEFSMMG